MPTENRSSNTEMVGVPRDLLARACSTKIGMTARKDRHAAASEVRAILAQPAPQPHPDPIAWMVGTAFWWTKEEAERDAAETGLPIVGLGPMTGHGEVERCEARLHEVASLCASVEQERDALRIQLAERDALPQFAQTVIRKLKRFRDCAEDCQGADIGKTWFDVLVQLGLLNRVQRSPAWWEITDEGEALLDGRVALSASAEPSAPVSFQARVQPWLMQCFGEMIAGDREERNHRFLEEALELVQALGATAAEAHQLVDYVFGRAVGEPGQEVGGVMVTLAALCLANGLDMHRLAETELARIWTEVDAIRAKQASKPQFGPLPGVYPHRKQ